jgi:hypothetical protein
MTLSNVMAVQSGRRPWLTTSRGDPFGENPAKSDSEKIFSTPQFYRPKSEQPRHRPTVEPISPTAKPISLIADRPVTQPRQAARLGGVLVFGA